MTSSPDPSDAGPKPVQEPKTWHYVVAFILLMLAWVLALELWLKPAFLAVPGAALVRRLGLYLLPPLATVLTVYVLRLAYVRRRLGQEEEQAIQTRMHDDARRREEEAQQASIRERKRFTLDILALGVAVEHLRQDQVWEELQSQEARESILPTDPADYPDTRDDKEKAHREREAEVLDLALGWLNDEWAVPTFLVGPALHNPQMMALLESNVLEALGHGEVPGRKLRVVDVLHDETPDLFLQRIFDFLEAHPEVPAVLLVAEDGLALRDCLRDADAPELIYDGPRPRDAMAESVVAFLLGRKERVACMQAYIQGDPTGRDALKPFWEKELASRTAGAFKTSEWLPSAWSKPLLEAFSELPVMGRLHRPQYVQFQGKGEGSRVEAVKEAWEAALQGLDEGGKHEHLIYDFGPVTQGRRLTPLSRTMVALDPDFDVFDQGCNLHRSLGDTGAASPFLGAALATLTRGVSASVFLRREEGASLFMVSPAPEDPGETEVEPPTIAPGVSTV